MQRLTWLSAAGGRVWALLGWGAARVGGGFRGAGGANFTESGPGNLRGLRDEAWSHTSGVGGEREVVAAAIGLLGLLLERSRRGGRLGEIV